MNTDKTKAGEEILIPIGSVESCWFMRKEPAKMIDDGTIEDAKTMVGFLTWRNRKK
jgi:hypothetical protein